MKNENLQSLSRIDIVVLGTETFMLTLFSSLGTKFSWKLSGFSTIRSSFMRTAKQTCGESGCSVMLLLLGGRLKSTPTNGVCACMGGTKEEIIKTTK